MLSPKAGQAETLPHLKEHLRVAEKLNSFLKRAPSERGGHSGALRTPHGDPRRLVGWPT